MDCEKMGQLIAVLRKEQNMTQKELAEKLFITDKAVSKWERGLACPDISALVPLSEILEVSVTELLMGQKLETVTAEQVQEALKSSIDLGNRQVIQVKHSFQKTCILLIVLIFLIGSAAYSYLQAQKVSKLDVFWEYLSETSIVEAGYEETADHMDGGLLLEEYLGLRASVITARTHLVHLPQEIQRDYGQIYGMMMQLYDRINALHYDLMQPFIVESGRVLFRKETVSEIREDMEEMLEQYRALNEEIDAIYTEWKNSPAAKYYDGLRAVLSPWTPPSQ